MTAFHSVHYRDFVECIVTLVEVGSYSVGPGGGLGVRAQKLKVQLR